MVMNEAVSPALSAIRLRQARAEDQPALSSLHARVFGPGRFARTSYRIREKGRPLPELSLVAETASGLAGSVHLTPVTIGGTAGALLLGPLVVAPAFKGRQTGIRLVSESIKRARKLGFSLIILVGEPGYFARAGFAPVPSGQITLPGPADPARLLCLELAPGALANFTGPAAAQQDLDPSS